MRILISGGGIAGLTLAWWLDAYGFEPVIVEASPRLRNKGYMMDFFGAGIDVAGAMGLLGALHEREHRFDELLFTNRHGRKIGSLSFATVRAMLDGRYLSIMRGDLEEILHGAIEGRVAVRFGTSIRSLAPSHDSVAVTFENGVQEAFDLVIGADGIHSNVRTLAFGPEENFSHHLGFHVATYLLPARGDLASRVLSFTEVDRSAVVYPIGQDLIAPFLVFASPDAGPVPRERRTALLRQRFAGSGSFVPALLASVEEGDDVLFDAVSQIRMPGWSKGRIGLVGDAAACLTLMAGQGSSMAMAEAFALATELKRRDGDHAAAFAGYERVLRPIALRKQVQAVDFARSAVPSSRWRLWLYNRFVRFMNWPVVLRRVLGMIEEPPFLDDAYQIGRLTGSQIRARR